MIGVLHRLLHQDKQTLGRFYLYNDTDEVFKCVTLELPDRGNAQSISSICSGVYTAKLRYSDKYGWHYHILDVEGRELILIHFGNYYTDTRGCILFGNDFSDINKDGYNDVTSSRKTMERFLDVAPKEFKIMISDTYLI